MKRIGNLRWWIIGLVTLGTVLNYLARSSLSVAAPTLKSEFGMTTEDYSWVVMAFQGSYTIMQTVAGAVLDALGTRIGFGLFAVGWALANMAHALATGWPSLAFFRGLLGATEAAAIPAGTKAVSEWFPPRERAMATGVSDGHQRRQHDCPATGGILHHILGLAISVHRNRGAQPGVGCAMVVGLPHSCQPRRLSEAERAHIEQGREEDDVKDKPATRSQVLKSRSFWAIAIPRFLAEPAWQTFNFFIPLYLVAVWHLDLKSIALWAWLPFLAADFGSLVSGLLPGWLMRRGSAVVTSRKITMTFGATCMVGPACIGLAGSPGLAIILFCIGGFAHQMLSGALLTLCADVFDSGTVATASGMTGTIAWFGGMLFTFAIGQSADTFGYGPLFVALALLDFVGAAVLWILMKKSKYTA